MGSVMANEAPRPQAQIALGRSRLSRRVVLAPATGSAPVLKCWNTLPERVIAPSAQEQ